jgi:hypothetical protein
METIQIACLLIPGSSFNFQRGKDVPCQRSNSKEPAAPLQPHFTSVSFNLHQAKEIKLLAGRKVAANVCT